MIGIDGGWHEDVVASSQAVRRTGYGQSHYANFARRWLASYFRFFRDFGVKKWSKFLCRGVPKASEA
jgi:hypothetical protein